MTDTDGAAATPEEKAPATPAPGGMSLMGTRAEPRDPPPLVWQQGTRPRRLRLARACSVRGY